MSIAVLAAGVVALLVLAPDAVLTIFAGILFATFLHAGGDQIAQRTGWPSAPSVAVFAFSVVVIAAGAIVSFAPSVADQSDQLSQQIPKAIEDLTRRIEGYSWGHRLVESVSPERLVSSEWSDTAATAFSSTFGILGTGVIILFIGLYGAIAPQTYRYGLVVLLAPSLRARAQTVLGRVAQTLRSWLMGKLISMALVGVLTWLGLWLIDVPLAILLGLIAALLAFIPNIGPVIAVVPAVLLAFPDGTTKMLLVGAVYVAVQTIESYVITPLIQQETVSLPPAFVISVQLVFGVLFGAMGLALATPIAAVATTLIKALYIEDVLDDVPDSDAMVARTTKPAET